MKKIIPGLFFACFLIQGNGQSSVQYDASLENGNSVQYFKPKGSLFVGDCIPFFHDGTFYLYWLLDSGHHSALGGLGGHQWALSTSRDLKNWKHYPVVIGIDEEWEKSICTGSVVFYNSRFYAFYATRLIDAAGKVNEQLSYAVSSDGIHFTKQKPNPFYTYAPGYNKRNFRDPKVSVDRDGNFHLFVSGSTDTTAAMTEGEKGALVHLVSKDLIKWNVVQPVLQRQQDIPECPDYFKWNEWYYLVYGRGGNTFYLKSKKPYGPWEYPASQALNEDWSNVVKTASFTNGRKIAAGWVPSRKENKDNGYEIFGGNAVLRELIQGGDGTLFTKFPAELIPETGPSSTLNPLPGSTAVNPDNNSCQLNSPDGLSAAAFSGIPDNSRITMTIEPVGAIEEFGLSLKSTRLEDDGYKVRFEPNNGEVWLYDTRIQSMHFLNKPITVDIIMRDDIIDVCIDGKRCIVNRLTEKKGTNLWIYAKHGKAKFTNITVRQLINRQRTSENP